MPATRRFLFPALRVLLILAIAPTAAADVTDRIERTLPLPPGASLHLQITVGTVEVAGWDRPEVSLAVVRRAPDASGLARVPIDVDVRPDGVSIRAVQRDDGRDPALRTDVILRVPSAATLGALELFEGGLRLSDLSGVCAARVERGDISARNVSGVLRLETAIGSIRLERAALQPGGLIRLRVFNGDVEVGLRERPEHARVLALALGGAITSDLPLTRRERWGPRYAEATFGEGEPVLSIDVVNGDIAIRVSP